MFGLRNLSPGRLITYGLLAFASQKLARRGFRSYSQSRQTTAKKKTSNDMIDTASKDSFPASDPPAYMGHPVGPMQ